MSRVAKNPITVPSGVTVSVDKHKVTLKGAKGELSHPVHESVAVSFKDHVISVGVADESANAWAQAGTVRALLNNMVQGVNKGFERKLTLVGVGFRAKAQGQKLNLQLGFSHPIDYEIPKGVVVETPTQTEIILKGADKQMLGQVAAEIRGFRPPEPYKGKGVRYADEVIVLKETKKK